MAFIVLDWILFEHQVYIAIIDRPLWAMHHVDLVAKTKCTYI